MVTVKGKTTTRASELSFRESQGLTMPALRAILSGVAGIDSDVYPIGTHSLIGKERCKLSPRCISDALSETMVMNHPVDAQILNCYDTKAIDNAPAVLMGKVFPSVRYMFVDMRNHLSSFSPGRSPLLLFRQLLLGFSQCCLIFSKEARVSDHFSIRQGSKAHESNINTNRLSRFWKWLVLNFTNKGYKPLAGACAPNTAGLNFTFNRAMEDSLHRADFRQVDTIRIDRISALGIGEAIIPTNTTESRIARISTRLYPPKESLESKVNSHSHILQYLAMNGYQRWTLFLQGREQVNLVIHSKRLPPFFLGRLSLLKKMIVEPSALIQSVLQSCSLACRRIEAVAKGYLMHSYSIAQSMKGGKPCQASPSVLVDGG